MDLILKRATDFHSFPYAIRSRKSDIVEMILNPIPLSFFGLNRFFSANSDYFRLFVCSNKRFKTLDFELNVRSPLVEHCALFLCNRN